MNGSVVLRRIVVFTVLWVVLVEGDPAYFWYALLTVPVAVAASLVWLPPAGSRESASRRRAGLVRVRSAIGLFGWLLRQLVLGGVDVAARALARPVDVDAVEVVVPVRLTGGARAVSLAVLGLMPGTIVSHVGDGEAVVHTLSRDLDPLSAWQELERRVLAVLGVPDLDQ